MMTFTKILKEIKREFGSFKLSNSGKDVSVCCPVCTKKDGKKKLSISLETLKFHCWRCNVSGLGTRSMIKKLGVSIENNIKFEEIEKEEKVKLPDGFFCLGNHFNSKSIAINRIVSYLKKRKISQKDIWKFRIGTTFNVNSPHNSRVIIPSFDEFGDLNYFTSRSIGPGMRYLNSKTDRKKVIFNDVDIDWSNPVAIFEGPFDVIRYRGNATCLFGSSLNENYLLFKKIVAKSANITFFLDKDAKDKQQKIMKSLSQYGIISNFVKTESDKDAGDTDLKNLEEAIKNSNCWSHRNYLKHKINNIVSGSVL